jgi:hypothetical protein
LSTTAIVHCHCYPPPPQLSSTAVAATIIINRCLQSPPPLPTIVEDWE